MNLNDYETKHSAIYQAFAETVRFILKKAFLTAESLPRPQSIQYRAKEIESLRRRLTEEGKLSTQALELDRRDLAGARIIFYTNNDVNRFIQSSLIQDNFEVEPDSTKIHHPTPENQGEQYRGIHYTVRLREDRIRLPEYAQFADLRCEIQIQTILEHAWAETSHDILYKNKMGKDFGAKAMVDIKRRFDRISDKYLVPAGYEIQKAQQDFEQLLQGRQMFDKDISILLDKAQNNNERYEILSGLKDYAILNYNDLPAAYEGLRGPLLRAVKAARSTEPVQIETVHGNLDGFKTDAVTTLVVEIIEDVRYADAVGTLQLLIDIYRDEPSGDIRQQIVNVVKHLSEYNINVYNKVGPMLQMVLVDYLASMGDAEVDNIRSIALLVWTEAIKSNISGAKWKVDSVVLSRGALPVSEQLREVRDKTLKALFEAYERSTDDEQKRAILSALDAATKTPNQAQYSNHLLSITLNDATRIVEFLMERTQDTSYELLQHLENQLLYDYRRAKDLTEDMDNRFGCQTEATALVAAILKFRGTINTDSQFVRYKVLVGFESVFPDHWTNEQFELEGAAEYRSGEATRYIGEINPENENEWFDFIERCAKTKSNDLATFPVYGNFISMLAARRPEVAARLFANASEDVRQFLPGLLNGLAKSSQPGTYAQIMESELELAKDLSNIAYHLRKSDVEWPDFAIRLLKRAIEKDDQRAVTGCFLLALEHYGTGKVPDVDVFVQEALSFLNDRENASWVSQGWFLEKATKFYEGLTIERTAQLLQNLGYVRKIDHRAERVLAQIARHQLAAVWEYFGARLSKDTEDDDTIDYAERFEAVPFQFYGLEKELSKNVALALSNGLSWFTMDQELFRFRGGRVVSNVFPNCTPEFATALADLVIGGADKEAEFALATLENYDDVTSAHIVLKEIVARFPDDQRKLNEVRVCIDNTGVVRGEFGFAEALQARKESMAEWLVDDRPPVQAFANKHMAELDHMIASERRRAEYRKEMRKRDYEEGDSELADNIGNEGEH